MKEVVDYVVRTHRYSQRKACRLTRQHRSTQRKRLISDPRTELRLRMREISQTHIRYGYRRIHIILKRGHDLVQVLRVFDRARFRSV